MSNSIENQNNFDERTHLGTQNCVWLQQSETIIYVFKFIKSIKKYRYSALGINTGIGLLISMQISISLDIVPALSATNSAKVLAELLNLPSHLMDMFQPGNPH